MRTSYSKKDQDGSTISQVMQRIGTSYVQWFNAKSMLESATSFQDRFLSVPVELDSQILAVLLELHPSEPGQGRNCLRLHGVPTGAAIMRMNRGKLEALSWT